MSFPQFLLFTTNSSLGMLIIAEWDGIDIGSFLFSNSEYKPEGHQHIFFNEFFFYHSVGH